MSVLCISDVGLTGPAQKRTQYSTTFLSTPRSAGLKFKAAAVVDGDYA